MEPDRTGFEAHHEKSADENTGGIFLLTEDYCQMYSDAVQNIPGRDRKSYEELSAEVFSKGYFYGDAYIDAFKQAGIPVRQSVPQCDYLQSRWARENAMFFPPRWLDLFIIRGISRRLFNIDFQSRQERLFRIVTGQIKAARPRILWVFSGVPVNTQILEEWRRYAERLFLWHSCPLWSAYPFECYDAIFTSIRSLVDHFHGKGIKCYFLPHAFDPKILRRVTSVSPRQRRVVFAGSLGAAHQRRTDFLDRLSRQVDVDYYGPGCDGIPAESPLRKNYRGPAWGNDLYSVFGSYLITIHVNIEVAGTFPSAKRLYESTGMGICLLIESHEGIEALFEPNKEIVTFDDFNDCVKKIRELLDDPSRAEEIGRRGQERTLKNHTYALRIKHFLAICREELDVANRKPANRSGPSQ